MTDADILKAEAVRELFMVCGEKAESQRLRNRIEELEREIVARRKAEEELGRELRRFRGLYDLAIAMTTDRSLDENLQLIVEKSRDILQTDLSHIALLDESSEEFYKHSSSGIRTEAYRNLRLPLEKGLGGLVARTRKGCIVSDYLAESHPDAQMAKVIADEGIVSAMAAPVCMGTAILGVLYVLNRTGTTFSQADLDTLSLIGNLAAVEIARKRMEEVLRCSEERFRFMAETTRDVIYRLRYDSMSYDYISPGIATLTGYSQEEISQWGFGTLVTRIDLPGEENVAPQRIAQERLKGMVGEYRADYLIWTKDGQMKWVRDHSSPWRNESGEIIGSVGILSDISEYKRAEALVRQRTADLIESEEKYRTLVENVPLVVYRMGASGEVLFVNQFVEELFGYGPEEILQDPSLWTENLYGEDRVRVAELRRRSAAEGKEFITEYRVRHKKGHMVYVIDQAIPSFSADGRVNTMDGIIMDVTGRVKLQEDLVRTEGLKTISEVSERLAHEIRNPLVSAGGFARRLLSSMGPEDPNRPKVEIIVKEVGRLELILRMILSYIQPVELHHAMTDLNRLIQDVVESLQGELDERAARVDLHLHEPQSEAWVDPKQMQRVLENLLRAALSQMPVGSSLAILTSEHEGLFTLTMRYPAQHMAPDDVDHYFYPFTTFQKAHAIVDLPTSKILVEKHGGTIQANLEGPGRLLIQMALPIRQPPS